MATPKQGQDRYIEGQFPLSGLYLASEFESQPPNSTPIGVNVRTFETLTGRGRGGSRPGLKRYIDDQLIPGVKVQHLAVIVDPQAAALFGGVGDGTNAVGRNLDGGLGGYPPVRHPIQPGRTPIDDNTRPLLTITANDRNKTYGDTVTFLGTEFTLSGSIGILDSVDTVTLTSTGSAATAQVAGSPFAIKASHPVGTGIRKYRFHFVDGALAVAAAALDIAAIDQTKAQGNRAVYLTEDENNKYFEYTPLGVLVQIATAYDVTGLLNSDTVDRVLLKSMGTAAAAAIGSYDIMISEALGTGLSNYTIAYIQGTLTVGTSGITLRTTADSDGAIHVVGSNVVYRVTAPGVQVGDLLVVALGSIWYAMFGESPYTITDNLGNTYTQIRETLSAEFIPVDFFDPLVMSAALWYCISGSAGDCTVEYTAPLAFEGGSGLSTLSMAVYAGVANAPPDGSSGSTGFSSSNTTGSVPVLHTGTLVVALVYDYYITTEDIVADGFVPDAGFETISIMINSGNQNRIGNVAHGLLRSAATALTGTFTQNQQWVAVGASFKKA